MLGPYSCHNYRIKSLNPALVTEGASDQASSDAGREAVAGWGRWRCGADHPTGGPSRLVPARPPRVAGPRDGGNGTGHRLAGPDLGPQRWIGGLPIREERRVASKRAAPRGGGGKQQKTERRAPWQ